MQGVLTRVTRRDRRTAASDVVGHFERRVIVVVVVLVRVCDGADDGRARAGRSRRRRVVAARERALVRRVEQPPAVGHHTAVQHQLERGDEIQHVEHHDRHGQRLIARLRPCAGRYDGRRADRGESR